MGKESLMEDYIDALSKEIELHSDKIFKTIFIGGGTPTYLSLNCISALGKSIEKLKLTEKPEITIECNPGTVDEQKLKMLKCIGINRLSIGLQAWQDSELKKMGRIHTKLEFLDTYQSARKLGFNNINIDLMFGIPGQSLDAWIETLENIIKLKPEHISCYSLIIEEGTCFYEMYQNNELDVPDEDTEREMYTKAKEKLKTSGYHQYEISNFALQNMECKHNLVYWSMEEYIGCGAAAHSYYNGVRYNNINDIEKYINLMHHGKTPKENEHINSINDEIEEYVFLGLRKIEGISEKEFLEKFGVNISDIYGEIINKYLNNKLLIKNGDKIFLSDKGIEVSNVVMSDFILS